MVALRRASPRARVILGVLAALACAPHEARARGPVVWDEDGDGIDDRIGTVQALGFRYSFENGDSLARQRFEVARVGANLVYGIYVVYDHAPTAADLDALTSKGVVVQHRLTALPAVRTRATADQINSIRELPGVTRVEVVLYLYSSTRDACAAIGLRDATGRIVPTAANSWPQADGRGVVVAILDTGINDQPNGVYPGHESLIGRCVGGAEFTANDSTIDTAYDGSVNPADFGAGTLGGHGTHVASVILGDGGPTGFTQGVAPAARFVDVKVLSELGSGTGLPEAIDWCIANRTRDWGLSDPAYRGIDVMNLSLSSIDLSDGQDLASQLCNVAAQAGIVVVASMGNDGLSNHVPSPAAGDAVIAVGAFDDQRSGRPYDDLAVSEQNTGPRADDRDADPLDELRPTLLAPGVAVLAANGNLDTDGTRYVRRSGTSMSAAFVSGAAAALRSFDPSLGPGDITATLIATARRNGPGLPAGAPSFDPRWSATRGFGVLDLYAAFLERVETTHTQVRRLMVSSNAASITAEAWTMRERGAPEIVFERAPDASGAPGVFVPVDSLPTTGDPSLLDGNDTHVYTRTWTVPPAEYGTFYWYRVATNDGSERRWSAPARMDAATGPSDATIVATIVHDAYDTDVGATVIAGGGAYSLELPGSSAAIATDYIDGISALGTIAQTFRVEVPQGAASAWLPPSQLSHWDLALSEGGFLNRSGRLTEYQITWHGPGGDVTYSGGPLPLQTIEGATVTSTIPALPVGVGPSSDLQAAVRPNPVAAGGLVAFAHPAGFHGSLEVFDLAGRRVAAIDPGGAGSSLRWRATDGSGHPLSPGVYLARFGSRPAVRFVVVRR